MKRRQKPNITSRRRRHNERGAALIMMLLISMLLLAAGGALIMTTAMTATTVYDSTPEAQAYYAAETGLEDALNVLRGNRPPNNVGAPGPGGTVQDADKISFRRAIMNNTSNTAGDSSALPRLSRWLNYHPNFTDRAAIGPNYSPLNGTAYAVTLRDPDNSASVRYTVMGKFGNNSTVFSVGGAVLTYTPPPSNPTNSFPAVAGSLGTITISYPVGVTVSVNTTLTLNINQISPWPATYTVLGKVSGIVGPAGVKTIAVNFNEATAVLGGTLLQLTSPLPLNASVAGATTVVPVTITAPEPRRLVVSSIGYGPKGAMKHLEMTLDNFNFAIRPPSPICIRGADDPSQPMTFDLGSSNAKRYIGVDASGQQPVAPAVAISLHDWTAADTGIKKGATVQPSPPAQADDPKLAILDHTIPPSMVPNPNPVPDPWASPPNPAPVPAILPPPAVTPDFLRTANAAREFLYGANGNGGLRAKARAQNRYFDTPFNGLAGDYNTGGFTFVDHNCELDGGGGLLVVTGNLVLKGNSDFRGIILVMGNGRVTRSGGGNANIRGAWIVANFSLNGSGNFGAPSFDVSGGGGSTFEFDWAAIVSANRAAGLSVGGVSER
ncbi:MAG: hypothetical protein LC803_05095 [Acidobacteria bacterium]|nr:hypothetical protein [Acidobacteriota bacterium]